MLQQWLNLSGLILDFIGVIILGYEWLIALRADEDNAEKAAFQNRIRPNPMVQQHMQQGLSADALRHRATHDHMRAQLEFQRESALAQGLRGMRSGWFKTAMVFIAGGFLLQILGSLPLDLAGLLGV
jgi:hypothetical protein